MKTHLEQPAPIKVADPAITWFQPPILVPYSQEITPLLRLGHYGYFKPEITSANFPSMYPTDQMRVLGLAKFPLDVAPFVAIKWAEGRGIRLADAYEILAFGAKYQGVTSLIALGELADLNGHKAGIELDKFITTDNRTSRRAMLRWWDIEIPHYCRILLSADPGSPILQTTGRRTQLAPA